MVKIAVKNLTLSEISDMFQKLIEMALPKSKWVIEKELKRQKKYKISRKRWIKTYEEFKGAKLNFYCEKIPTQESPIVSIGITYTTTKGLILIAVDTSNGGIPASGFIDNIRWEKNGFEYILSTFARDLQKEL